MSFEIVSEFRAWQIWQHSSCMQVCLITLGPLLHWSFRRVILGQCCRSFAAGNASPRRLRLSEKQQKQFIFQFPIYFRSVCFCYVYIYICFLLQPHLSSTPHVFDCDGCVNRPEAENFCSAHTLLCLDHAVSFRQNCTVFRCRV